MDRPRQLTLGIDIDGTVTEPSCFIPYLNRAFGKNLSKSDITRYELHPFFEVTEQEMAAWFSENCTYVYANSPIQDGAKEVLDGLSQDAHELVYISAREVHEYGTTFTWFHTHDVPYDSIHLIGSHRKVETAREQEIDVFLEDKYDNACDVCEALSIPVILFDTPYNQGNLPELAYRVKDWYEVPAIIRRMCVYKKD